MPKGYSIENVRISIPRSELENSQQVIETLELESRVELDEKDLSCDSESDTEKIIFNSTTPVGKFIEVNSKDVAEVIFETEELHESDDQHLNRPFECDICHKMFTRIEILRRHMKTHMVEKDFKCTYCGKAFDRRDVLNDHMRNHTGEKPFQCTVCNKKFTRGFVLLRHMRIHTEGDFKCKFCLKTFDRKDTYRDHVRNHTGEKPFKCKYCNKSFSRSFVLTKHEKGHETRADTLEEETDIHKAETILVEELDYDDQDVKNATDMLLQKEFDEQTIQVEIDDSGVIEQEIIEEDFIQEEELSLMQSHHLHSDTLVSEAIVEEVVETEAITLATSDGQIVRVISREQYDKLIEAASRAKTYKCETCNRTFTAANTYQEHYNLPWEKGGCISAK